MYVLYNNSCALSIYKCKSIEFIYFMCPENHQSALTVEVEIKVAQGSLLLFGAGAFVVNVECHQSSFMTHNVGNRRARYTSTNEECDYHCPHAVKYMTTAKTLCCFQPTECFAVWIGSNAVLVA